MLHNLIRLLLTLLSPFVALAAMFRLGVRETRARFGAGLPSLPGCVWVHAASVGEVNAVRPLLEEMLRRWPQRQVFVTTMTTTGLAQAGRIKGVQAHLVPIDIPWVMKRAFQRIHPDMLVLVETELWPEMLRQAHSLRVPVAVVNGRLSASSLRRYTRFGAMWRPLLRLIAAVGAQSRSDAKRYRLLWQPRVDNTGNLKFCVRFPDYDHAKLRMDWGLRDDDFVVAFGSSRPGEEALMHSVLPQLRAAAPGRLRLVVAPRHLRRLDEVRTAFDGDDVALRSENREAEVMIVDEMGVLTQAYALADIALVGGSFLDGFGGHNPIEACYFGVPTIMGPHHKSCQDTVRVLREGRGIDICKAEALAEHLVALAVDAEERARLGQAGREVVQANALSVEKNMTMLQNVLDKSHPLWRE